MTTSRVGTGHKSFKGIKRVQRTQQVREQLERAIDRGDFKPGDRLPSERQLVELLGVSRITVREAIRSLEALGRVEVHQGRGCFVAETPADGYMGPFGHWLAVHRDEVLELLRVRGALDELAAEAAAERGDAGALASVREAHEAFAAAAAAGDATLDRLCELDIRFHETIAEASGSALLTKLLRDLNTYLSESRKVTMTPRGRPERSAREHGAIVDAIVAARGPQARSAVARHIAAARASFIALGGQSTTTGKGA